MGISLLHLKERFGVFVFYSLACVCTAKPLSLHHMLGLQSSTDRIKYLSFREGTQWRTEKQYFMLSTCSIPLSSLSQAFSVCLFPCGIEQVLKQKVRIHMVILRALQETLLLHHLHVSGNSVAENSQPSWDHCLISKKQAVNAERRLLPCQSARQSNLPELSQRYFCAALLCLSMVYSLLHSLNCYVRLEEAGLVISKMYYPSPSQRHGTDPYSAAFVGRRVDLWVKGNRNFKEEELEGTKQWWCCQAGLSARLRPCLLLEMHKGWWECSPSN